MGCKVADAGTEGLEVGHHTRETSAGTDALLLAHVFDGHAVVTVQFPPCALYHDIEGEPDPTSAHGGEVVGCLYAHGLQAFGVLSADAPDFIYGVKLQGFDALLVSVYVATVILAWIVLGIVAGHLCQGLCRADADADWHAGAMLNGLV